MGRQSLGVPIDPTGARGTSHRQALEFRKSREQTISPTGRVLRDAGALAVYFPPRPRIQG